MAGGNQPEDGAQRKAWREREVGLQHESQNVFSLIDQGATNFASFQYINM